MSRNPSPDQSASSSDDVRLQDLLDGRLDDDAAEALRARIAAEPALQEAWDELRGIQALVRGYGPQGADLELPGDFLDRVKARVVAAEALPGVEADRAQAQSADVRSGENEAAAPPRRPGRMLRMLTVAYAAAALLVVGFTVRYVLDDGPAAREDVRTAKESVDRKARPEADAAERERDKQLESGFAQDLEKPSDGGEPAGSLHEAPEMRPPAAPAPDAKTEGPALGGGKVRRGDDAGGPKVGGRFGAPGGAIQPGARPLPGTKSRARRGGTGEVARKERLGRLLSDAEGPVYVLEVGDASQARAALAALLADESMDEPARDGRSPTGKPKSTDLADDDDVAPRRKRGAAEAPADAPAEAGKTAPRVRLFRVEAGQAERLLAALRSQAALEKSEQKDAAAEDAYTRLALLEVATPELDAAALARLDRRASEGVWGRAVAPRPVKKSASDEPQGAPALPTPTTPAPPASPQSPAPTAPFRPAAGAPSKDAPSDDAPSRDAPSRDAPSRDAPSTDEEDEAAGLASERAAKSARPKAAPRRVRILVLQRR